MTLEHDATPGVRVLTLVDPDRRNALSPQLQADLSDDEQRRFLREGNLPLRPPLIWHTYGDRWVIR